MDKKNIELDDTAIEDYEFQYYESPISISDININRIIVSNKLLFGKQDFKYFIGYKDARKVRSLYIFRSRMGIYKKDFDQTKYMYFLIK